MEFYEKIFDCPHCNLRSKHSYHRIHRDEALIYHKGIHNHKTPIKSLVKTAVFGGFAAISPDNVLTMPSGLLLKNTENWSFDFSICTNCNLPVLWVEDSPVYPTLVFGIPDPDENMSSLAKEAFIEAKGVIKISKRASLMLLRLCLDYMLIDFGIERSIKLHDKINLLKKSELPVHLIKGLEILRKLGNEGAHPSTFEINQMGKEIENLFTIINFISKELSYRKLIFNSERIIKNRK